MSRRITCKQPNYIRLFAGYIFFNCYKIHQIWHLCLCVVLRGHLTIKEYYPYNYNYSVILLVLDPRKCEYLKDYSLDFEHAYMTTYIAS